MFGEFAPKHFLPLTFFSKTKRTTGHTSHLSHKKKTRPDTFHEILVVKRDPSYPYFMVYYKSPHHWVGFHPKKKARMKVDQARFFGRADLKETTQLLMSFLF